MTLEGDVPIVSVTCVERTGRMLVPAERRGGSRHSDRCAESSNRSGTRPPSSNFWPTLARRNASTFRLETSIRTCASMPSRQTRATWNGSCRTSPCRNATSPRSAGRRIPRGCCVCCWTGVGHGSHAGCIRSDDPGIRDCGLFACRVFVPKLVPLCVPSAPFLGHPRLAGFVAAANGTARCVHSAMVSTPVPIAAGVREAWHPARSYNRGNLRRLRMTRKALRVLAAKVMVACVAVPTLSRSANELTVHEWGTFTSVAGPDGEAVEWLPLTGSTDLPAFVEHFRDGQFKSACGAECAWRRRCRTSTAPAKPRSRLRWLLAGSHHRVVSAR